MDLLGFVLDVSGVMLVIRPTSQVELDRVFNVSCDSGFELWGLKEAADESMNSFVKASIDLEDRVLSQKFFD